MQCKVTHNINQAYTQENGLQTTSSQCTNSDNI
jgi:hypothetical protein